MDKRFIVKLSILALVLFSFGMHGGQEVKQLEPLAPPLSEETGEMLDETPSLWFVELPSLPTADGSKLATVRKEKEKFRAAAKAVGLRYHERFAFDTLWNGLSIQLEPGELAKLNRIRGVREIYPVESIDLPEDQQGEYIELATALAMTGADIAQSELGYTGAGVRVGIIDTGIDYDHPDLGGGFGPGYRVETGWDFVGNDFDGSSSSVPVPDPDPDDCDGHGTHVAGIVGANGDITGVAPGVTFGAYRVFGCSGSTWADIMIAAMERALADDMDIVNMSMGSAFQWPQYPTAQAGDRLVNKGVVVVASAGNSGSSGLYSASAPGVGKKVIGVASFDNSHQSLPTFTISHDNTSIGYTNATGALEAPDSGNYPMDRTGTPASAYDACFSLPAGSLAGEVALIRRGGCSFRQKALNALAAGAEAVVIYNNVPGRFNPTVGSPPLSIPVVAISLEEGLLIDGRLASGSVYMTWTDQLGYFPNSTGGLISSMSSYGLSPDLSLKPDIGAPGGLIRSTYPLEYGGSATMSGTSMASPHVAGAAALLLEAKPHTPAQVMGTILQNSADPALWSLAPSYGFLDHVHRQGAGMLDIDDAILAEIKIEPGELSLGESETGPSTHTLSIENNGSTAVIYDLSYVNALTTGGVISPSFWLSNSSVSFSSSSVIVPAYGTATVDVTINPATYPTYGQYGGYIVFTPQGGGQVYRVPFAGFVGDYQSIPTLTPTAWGFPWLAKLIGGYFYNQPGGATYTMTSGDIPYILVHLDHQVRRLRMEVFDVNKGKAWHRALDIEYFRRNTTPTSFWAFTWDGLTYGGQKIYQVPDGQYVIKLSIQKALGDDGNPAHWETWTSPVITIDRP